MGEAEQGVGNLRTANR